MTAAAPTLAHAQALLRAIAQVHADAGLGPEARAAILTLLLGCVDDARGDHTLDVLDAIFEAHDAALSEAVAARFATLTTACHVLGQAQRAVL